MKGLEMTGIYQGTGRGYGFFIPEDGSDDWFVPPHQEGGAWDGDTVKLTPDLYEAQSGERTVGRVTAVLERANRDVVGTVRKEGRQFWLAPDNTRLPMILLTNTASGKRISAGQKVAVHILSYGGKSRPPMGRLVESFGRADSRDAAVEAALFRYGIEDYFPPDVQAQAEQAPEQVEEEALKGRLDLRQELIVTIDGAGAKDLDDAVSLRRDEQNRLVLGVHIADVSHYVREGSALDREAWERGTSVYFADRVVPMLPVQLSNGICSLNPQVDRLTLSCIMTLDGRGNVVEHKIAKSVIRTTARLTYIQCNRWLEGAADGADDLRALIADMAALAAKLERKRRLRGALELESAEAVILCDPAGHPIGMELREQGRAEKLIEEFMLLSNETVAKHLHDGGLPGVYRVHEKPSADKVERLRTMLEPLGLDVKAADHFALQKILDTVKDKPEAGMVNMLLLRSLMKARYDGENLGHFGLAAEYYCHFTSPIRRYPDLMVHRILSAMLTGELNQNRMRTAAQKAAVQSSERELAAQNAERDIEKFYMAEFMQNRIGETFAGTVSGVTRFGVYVLLPFGAEGMIPAESLPGRDWDFDEAHMTLKGRSVSYTFGMPLDVVCVRAEPGTGQIDFRLAGEPVREARHDQRTRQIPKKKNGKRPPVPRRR